MEVFWLVVLALPLVPLLVAIRAAYRAVLKRGEDEWLTAILGLVFFCITGLLVWGVAWGSFRSLRRKEAAIWCLSNTKHLGMALMLYREDSGDAFPPARTWCDAVLPYVKSREVFGCRASRDPECGYAFSADLGGVDAIDELEAPYLVAVFESDAGWNAHGGRELLPAEARHWGGDDYTFADGHASWVSREAMRREHPAVRWERGEGR